MSMLEPSRSIAAFIMSIEEISHPSMPACAMGAMEVTMGAMEVIMGAMEVTMGAMGPMEVIMGCCVSSASSVSYLDTTRAGVCTQENRTKAATTKRAKYIMFLRDISNLNFLFNIFIF
jgi:glutamate synthase domain-containing protein 2